MKKIILGFVLGLMTATGLIGIVYALNASDIDYKETKVDQALDNLYTKALEETEMKLLWTNSNPNVPFAAQTIPLDLSNYKYVVINATYGGNGITNDYFTGHKSIIEVGTTSNITGAYGGSNGQNLSYGSAATIRETTVTTSGITFDIGKFYDGSNKNSNNYAVPLNIWGIK